MIAVRIEGRLGNQLFQYAFIYSAAKKLNTSFYCDKGIEKFKLYDYFDIQKDLFYPLDRYVFNTEGFKNIFNYHLRRFAYKVADNILLKKKPVIIDNEDDVVEAIQRLENKKLYYGFFQSQEYFKQYENDIKTLFKIKIEFKEKFAALYSKLDLTKTIVVVHVRRTDYVGMGIAVDIEYYHNAIKRVRDENSFFVFISDDSKFVEEQFNDIEDKYISTHSEIIDFQFLMHADVCILSCSSFSWWGAYLNNKVSEVIVPKYWLGWNKAKEYPNNIILDRWTQL